MTNNLQGIAALAEAIGLNKEDHSATYDMLVELLQREADKALHPIATAAAEQPEPDYTEAASPAESVSPSFEEVWGSSPPGLSRTDFETALRVAGYDTGPRGFAQWGAQDWEHLSIDQRKDKLSAVHALIQQNAPVQSAATGPSDHQSVLQCPSGQPHGEAYQNRTKEGKPFYKCRTPSCHRPGSDKTTTWDDSNYSKRQEEFRTGQPYQPAGGQWRGR